MTYATYETSLDLGAPVELYRFTQGTVHWFYCSTDRPVLHEGQTYEPSPISRDRIKQSSDAFKDGLKITLPRDNLFGQQFIGFAPEEVTTLTIMRGHDGDVSAEFQISWKGRVVGARAEGNSVSLDCESVFTSIRRPGLRARFEYGCRHTLYGARCGAMGVSHKVAGTVDTSSSLTVSVLEADLHPDGHFTGGMIEVLGGGLRFVTNHTGSQLTLARPFGTNINGASVFIYPGCDHLRTTCLSKFNNLDNFGGFPFIPSRNPLNGSSII